MNEAYCADIASRGGDGVPFALVAANWLGLLATPTFAMMALITCLLDRGPAGLLCSATQEASALSGMVPMYLLMCAFHSAPWLKLISGRSGLIKQASSQ
jgi:hypothetical protein